MVSRSASNWHGWKSSDSALITGTRMSEAISSSPDCANVRHTIAATCRSNTRAVSAIDSLLPSWLSADEMTSGTPPRSAIPTANDTRVRVDVLSKMAATVWGPASGRCANRLGFICSARSSTSACSARPRASSRKKCRVILSPSFPPRYRLRRCLGYHCERPPPPLGEFLNLHITDDERRCKPNDAVVGSVDNEPFPQCRQHELPRARLGEHNTEQKPAPADLFYES